MTIADLLKEIIKHQQNLSKPVMFYDSESEDDFEINYIAVAADGTLEIALRREGLDERMELIEE